MRGLREESEILEQIGLWVYDINLQANSAYGASLVTLCFFPIMAYIALIVDVCHIDSYTIIAVTLVGQPNWLKSRFLQLKVN